MSNETARAETIGSPAQQAPRKGLILGFLSLTTFMVFLDADVVNTALPAIARDLEAPNSVLMWVVNMYSLILAGFLLVAGSAGDRFGRRKALGAGLAIFGAGALGAALAENSTTLIAMRGVQGFGAAFALPATLAIITDVFPREERAKAIATWTGIASLAIIVGPGLGGLVVDEIGWNAVFTLHLPLVGLALSGLTVIPESRDSRLLPLDIPGALLATGGVFALVYGIIQGGEAGWTSAEILGAFAGSAALFIAFAVVEVRSAHPMLPLEYFRQKDFTGPFLVMMLIFMGMVAVFFFLTQFFQIVQDRSAFVAGLALTPSALGMIVGAMIAGQATGKLGPKAVVVTATLIVLTAMGLFTQIEVDTPYWVALIGIVIFGLGAGLAMPAVTDTLMASVPVNDAGVGSAMNDLSREFGIALGVAAVGSVVSGVYRTNVKDALAGLVPEGVAESIGESVGSVETIAAGLPPELSATVIEVADSSFVDAIGTGYLGAAGFVVAALVVAIALVPRRMRVAQAVLAGEDNDQPDHGEAFDSTSGAPVVPATVSVRGVRD
jgi:EmrB/QacA subfamily drug resistance transporter